MTSNNPDVMASVNTMPNPQGRNLLAPPETLNIQGRGYSPQPSNDESMHSVPSSARSSVSEDDEEISHKSEEYTVLDGVREMNHILVRQIETLRLKIQIDERNSERDKARIVDETNEQLNMKDNEIDDLKDSLNNRDERIYGMMKASQEKDRQIESKSQEIETLKELVKQTENYAQKLQKQISHVISDKSRLDEDPLYKQQNEEMVKLTEELATLRARLASMEEELHRATKIIDKQNEKMKMILEEKSLMHAKFREDLDRVSKAMRQEVERMREVMRQNYEEMRNLREENKQMHDDVRDIKEMLKATRMSRGHQNSDYHETITGIQRPITASPTPLYARNHLHGQSKALTPKGPGSMMGGNIAQAPSFRSQRGTLGRDPDASSFKRNQAPSYENTQTMTRKNRSSFRSTNSNPNPTDTPSQKTRTHASIRSSLDTARSNLSPDTSARPMNVHKTGAMSTGNAIQHGGLSSNQQGLHPNATQNEERGGNESSNFPPICSLKDASSSMGKRSLARTAPKSGIRKGSAVRKL